MKIRIRKAKKRDFEAVLELILELARFEKLAPPDEKAKKRLYKDAFGKKPRFRILAAETEGLKGFAGYAFYFFTYSSFLARKSLYLEDIFITEKLRNKGIGKLFMDELNRIARKNKCSRMEWAVLDWNVNAIKFYDKLGAKPLKDWIYYRYQITNNK